MKKITNDINQESQATLDQQDVSHSMELKSLQEICKEAFDLYCSKFKIALGIMVVPVAISIILSEFGRASVSFSILHQASWPSVVKIILWFALLFFDVISISALLFSIKNKTGVKQSYLQSLKSASLFAPIVVLGLLTITGGFMMFIVPGLIFFTWFGLAPYAFIWEGKEGFEALRRSKQLVGGFFWKVFSRLAGIALAVMAVVIALGVVGKIIGDSHHIIGSLLHLFLMPLVVFFGIVLFQNLVTVRKHAAGQKLGMMISKTPYYLAAIIATPVISATIVLQMVLLLTGDVPNPNDSDLRLQTITVPRDQNSFDIFREAKDKTYWPQEEITRNGINEDFSKKILQNNEQSLSIFERGVAMSIFQIPELQDPQNYRSDTAASSVAFLRNLAKVNSLKAENIFEQGRQKEAFDQVMKTMKMGQMLEDGQNGTAGYLTGLGIKEIGVDAMRSLISKSALPSAELLVYERELGNYREGKFGLRNVLEGEYMTVINSKEEMGKLFLNDMFPVNADIVAYAERSGHTKWLEPFTIKSFYYYKPNKTTALLGEAFTRMLKNGNASSYSQVIHLKRKLAPWYVSVFTENRYGVTMASIPEISLDGIFSKKFEENFSVSSAQVLLALKAYKQDRGVLPDALEDLVPNYLPEPIRDPFDGGSLKYSVKNKILYSTGKDLVDNAGDISEADWRAGNDIGFRIEF